MVFLIVKFELKTLSAVVTGNGRLTTKDRGSDNTRSLIFSLLTTTRLQVKRSLDFGQQLRSYMSDGHFSTGLSGKKLGESSLTIISKTYSKINLRKRSLVVISCRD